MELVKGTTYFNYDKKKLQFPYLTESITTDILIIGGGTTGALALYYYSQLPGVRCCLIDGARCGMRSTSITTALLQYELELNYQQLIQKMPEEDVKRAYQLGKKGLNELEAIISSLGNHCMYHVCDTLLMDGTKKDIPLLKQECLDRQAMGIDTKLLEADTNPYPFTFQTGVFSEKGGARLNPFLFTQQLLSAAQQNGAVIYENTKAVKLDFHSKSVSVITEYGNVIESGNVIISCGYDLSIATQRQFCEKSVTYNIVTKPIDGLEDMRLLVRDNLQEYHYFRQTDDGRIILGGEDITFNNNDINESKADKKYQTLLTYLKDKFPDHNQKIEIDTAYCGAFGTTPDNLGVVGQDNENPQLFYCLGYGANGILFATMGAKMLARQYAGEYQKDLELLNPWRKGLADL